MSDVYNPETLIQQKIGELAVEAVALVQRRDAASRPEDRRMIERLLTEVEQRIASLRRQLRR